MLEKFELCGGVVTENDKKTVLLKKLPLGIPSSLVSALSREPTYDEMKLALDKEVISLKDWSPGPRGRPRTCC